MLGKRIVVVGTTGSGKSTLAAALAAQYAVPYVELDALHWGPNWMHAPARQFRDTVASAIAGDTWVVDGNYSAVRDLIWPRATTFIWLNYPLWLSLVRLFKRSWRRIVTGQQIWGTNVETFRAQFLDTDSLFMWAIKTHRRRRRSYAQLFPELAASGRQTLIFTSPADADRWLRELGSMLLEDPPGELRTGCQTPL